MHLFHLMTFCIYLQVLSMFLILADPEGMYSYQENLLEFDVS